MWSPNSLVPGFSSACTLTWNLYMLAIIWATVITAHLSPYHNQETTVWNQSWFKLISTIRSRMCIIAPHVLFPMTRTFFPPAPIFRRSNFKISELFPPEGCNITSIQKRMLFGPVCDVRWCSAQVLLHTSDSILTPLQALPHRTGPK